MDMANLPEITAPSTELDTKEAFTERVADLLHEGWTPARIARRMYPEDKDKRRRMRAKIHRMARYDQRLALEVGLRSKSEMLIGLGPTTKAVVQRAKRGRMDAAKLVFEATGFHNPKVKHEHSGEIKVKLEMPRPNYDHVADAEVVND